MAETWEGKKIEYATLTPATMRSRTAYFIEAEKRKPSKERLKRRMAQLDELEKDYEQLKSMRSKLSIEQYLGRLRQLQNRLQTI